jgi:hypothetical protein
LRQSNNGDSPTKEKKGGLFDRLQGGFNSGAENGIAEMFKNVSQFQQKA